MRVRRHQPGAFATARGAYDPGVAAADRLLTAPKSWHGTGRDHGTASALDQPQHDLNNQAEGCVMPMSHNSLVLYGFFLVVGGLLLALRARRAADSPEKNKSLMLAGIIVVTGLGFWAATLVTNS